MDGEREEGGKEIKYMNERLTYRINIYRAVIFPTTK